MNDPLKSEGAKKIINLDYAIFKKILLILTKKSNNLSYGVSNSFTEVWVMSYDVFYDI